MKTIAVTALTALLAVYGSAQATNITIDCGPSGQGFNICKAGAERWAKKTGNTVTPYETPNNSNDHLGIIQQQLAAQGSDVDVYQLDIIWPGLVGTQMVDLSSKIPASTISQHFPGIVAANKVDGRLVAVPWFTDAGLLYYRTDLLKKYGYTKAPGTWAEMAAMAAKIQAGEGKNNKQFAGFVFQGKDYEGLTCDALEWIKSYGGGTIVDTSGKITINNAQAAKALDEAASWVKTISPSGVTTYAEEEARGIFQAGNAAFMRNWPYAWALSQGADSKVKGLVGVAPLPSGGAGAAATLGGWNLGVNKYSKKIDLAIDLVKYMTSAEEQKIRAIDGSYQPTVMSLYKDKDVLAKNPFFGSLYGVFTAAVPRPSGATKTKYNQVSQAFSQAVSTVLTGKANGQAAVQNLATSLAKIKGSGW